MTVEIIITATNTVAHVEPHSFKAIRSYLYKFRSTNSFIQKYKPSHRVNQCVTKVETGEYAKEQLEIEVLLCGEVLGFTLIPEMSPL